MQSYAGQSLCTMHMPRFSMIGPVVAEIQKWCCILGIHAARAHLRILLPLIHANTLTLTSFNAHTKLDHVCPAACYQVVNSIHANI